MQLDPIDVSALTTSTLTFSYYGDKGTWTQILVPNIMYIEAYNGTSWDSVATFQEFNTGWVTGGGYFCSCSFRSCIVKI